VADEPAADASSGCEGRPGNGDHQVVVAAPDRAKAGDIVVVQLVRGQGDEQPKLRQGT
jgi:hypothetical protein